MTVAFGGVAPDEVEDELGRRPGAHDDGVEVPGVEQRLERSATRREAYSWPWSTDSTPVAAEARDPESAHGVGVVAAPAGHGVEGDGVTGLARDSAAG